MEDLQLFLVLGVDFVIIDLFLINWLVFFGVCVVIFLLVFLV